MHQVAQWFSDFADQSIVIPLAIVIAVVLVLRRRLHIAICWSVMVSGVLGVMLVLKLLAGACGWQHPALHVQSPSGHTAAAAMLYGGLTALILPPAARLWITVATSFVAAAAFGASRLILQVHTPAEVVIGGAVGIIGATLFHASIRHDTRIRVWPIAIPLIGVIAIAHGTRLPLEHQVHSFAAERLRLLICPVTTRVTSEK